MISLTAHAHLRQDEFFNGQLVVPGRVLRERVFDPVVNNVRVLDEDRSWYKIDAVASFRSLMYWRRNCGKWTQSTRSFSSVGFLRVHTSTSAYGYVVLVHRFLLATHVTLC